MPQLPLSDSFFFQVFDVKPGKNEQRKLRIVEAAINCMAKIGFDRTTFESIGKEAGMQRTHVNYYFATRDDLIKSAVRYVVAIGQQITINRVREAKGWRNQLKAVIGGPFEAFGLYPKHAPVVMIFYQLCYHDPDYKALQNIIRSGGEARLLACFEELIEQGKLTQKQGVELARAIQAMMTGNMIYSFTSDFPLTLSQVETWTIRLAFELVTNRVSRGQG